jgi:FKBP-type peptidyl-prolyl cis-trans isomerase (trigger factor)
VFSIFTETKKRAEKRRREDSAVDDGDKVVIDYKSLPATKDDETAGIFK